MRVIGNRRSASEIRAGFRRALEQPGLLVAPGVFDGMSALVAAEAGFAAVYVSGGAVSRAAGVPDLGVLSFAEMREAIRAVVDSVELPVVADADTGYGGVFNVIRTVRELEQIGVAALHLEDQVAPKRCGHYEDKAVVPVAEMCAKIAAAVQARADPNLVIIARTDAAAVEGFTAAVSRARAYRAAGADMLFVEAVRSHQEISQVPAELDAPLVLNMFAGGKTPLVPAEEVARLGYKLMIVPSDLQRAALFAMREAARVLRAEGSTASYAERMTSFSDRDQLVGLTGYRQLESDLAHRAASTAALNLETKAKAT